MASKARARGLSAGVAMLLVAAAGPALGAEPVLVVLGRDTAEPLRSISVDWETIEPQDGQWSFEALDQALDAGSGPVVITLFPGRFRGGAPPWAVDSFRPVFGPSANDYVRQIVARYQDRVKAWQVGHRWDSKPADPEAPARSGPVPVTAEVTSAFTAGVAASIIAGDGDALILGPLNASGEREPIVSHGEGHSPPYGHGDVTDMVTTWVEARAVGDGPVVWALSPERQRDAQATVRLLLSHLGGDGQWGAIAGLSSGQHGFRFARADGSYRWIVWGEGTVELPGPPPKASTSTLTDAQGRHSWKGTGPRITLSAAPRLIRN